MAPCFREKVKSFLPALNANRQTSTWWKTYVLERKRGRVIYCFNAQPWGRSLLPRFPSSFLDYALSCAEARKPGFGKYVQDWWKFDKVGMFTCIYVSCQDRMSLWKSLSPFYTVTRTSPGAFWKNVDFHWRANVWQNCFSVNLLHWQLLHRQSLS